MSNISILQLNVWMGKIEGNLRRFFQQHQFDIICLQEVMYSADAERHLSRLCFDASQIAAASGLPYVFFSPNWRSIMANGHLEVGNLILSRIPFIGQHSEFTHGQFVDDMVLGAAPTPGNNLTVQIATLENGLIVVNHHGFWRPDPLGDAESLIAFEKLAGTIRPYADQGHLVLCGDLNLVHDAPAMRYLDFLDDQTALHGVENTLSGLKFDGQVACDHIMTTPDLQVSNFIVHDDLISDHLAISTEISL